MDKSTLSNYGWVVIVTLVLAVMLALATPFGSYVGKGASNVIKTFVNTSNDAIDEDNIDTQGEQWDDYLNDMTEVVVNYSKSEIEADENLIPLGATKPEYVVGKIDETTSTFTVYKNGANSDGLMADFDESPVPQNIENLIIENGVKNIGNYAFEWCDFKNVTLANTIETIGEFALSSNINLTSISLPKNLKEIKEAAFLESYGIKTIEFNDGLENIGEYAFWCCPEIVKLDLPTTLKTIGAYAFESSYALTSLKIPNNVTFIGENAFACCEKLKTVILPEKLETIELRAFDQCLVLETISISNNNPYFKTVDNVLYSKDMTKLYKYPEGKMNTHYDMPDTITHIDEDACHGTKFTSISFSKNLTSISNKAFASSNIEILRIPNSITHIGSDAFAGRSDNIKEVYIPASVVSMGSTIITYNNIYYYCETQAVKDLLISSSPNLSTKAKGIIVDSTKF